MNLQPTPFDTNWRMFGIPVRVHPSFWLVAAIFAWPLAEFYGLQFWLIGIGCMFVSLLAHELAHALVFQYYRINSAILCYSFGGLTIPEGRLYERSRRIQVSLAGPFANFLIAGLVWVSDMAAPWAATNRYTAVLFFTLFRINLFWGLLNLLPVWPLDGGMVSRELWMQTRPRSGLVDSLKMSIVVAIAFSVYAFACHFNVIPSDLIPDWFRPGLFAAILFAILAFQSYTELQNHSRPFQSYDDRRPW